MIYTVDYHDGHDSYIAIATGDRDKAIQTLKQDEDFTLRVWEGGEVIVAIGLNENGDAYKALGNYDSYTSIEQELCNEIFEKLK